MKLNKWMKLILVGASALTLVACSSGKKPMYADNAAGADGGQDAYVNDAASSGIGERTRFGDMADGQSGATKRLANGKVYYFDFDSNVVHDSDKPAINHHANKLAAAAANKVMLEGHTDPRGSREYNIGLGERRAKSVAKIMNNKGVGQDQIRVVSYGAEKPASPGNTEADYQLDRRVVLVYTKG